MTYGRFDAVISCDPLAHVDDLNKLTISDDGTPIPLKNYAAISDDQKTRVIFKDLDRELLACIDDADAVVGCVAWLTHANVLDALARKIGVSIIVQKEDFLRPDLDVSSNWRRALRARYEQLPDLYRYGVGRLVCNLSVCSDPTLAPVRCVGNYNEAKAAAFPRMHHKFLIFCRTTEPYPNVCPYAVWTGSFNLTHNATRSFENAIVCTDKKIVEAFFSEYEQIVALSEPLNWEHKWVAPEYRIGT